MRRRRPCPLKAVVFRMYAHALIVAAGRGTRAGPGAPKQYRDLGGMTVLRRAVLALAAHPKVASIRVVIHADDQAAYSGAVAGLDLGDPVIGGATRQDSVRLGLEALAAAGVDPAALVLIHDAARVFVTLHTIDKALAALEFADGACPALPVVDTLRRGHGATGNPDAGPYLIAGDIVPRDGLFRAQTPQVFALGTILAAHRAMRGRPVTDDVAVAQGAGMTVALTPGDTDNYKITTAQDLIRAERTLCERQSMDIRFGTGFDVHAFADGDHVTLCGVAIPHDRGLTGHSDADVGMHALTDAIFGAIAEGDIGRWFPPSDPQWRGADSRIFLAKAAERVAARGGRILNVDVTLICERPKIGPHADAMRAKLAEILGLDLGRVSVKATTTERLGFTGREEGIAAQAAASVSL
ncbi:MAG: 2-C-methyl-D-erythritol 4-phosphate cytidylyltransferase [Paracoccaceae bacterium]